MRQVGEGSSPGVSINMTWWKTARFRNDLVRVNTSFVVLHVTCIVGWLDYPPNDDSTHHGVLPSDTPSRAPLHPDALPITLE